MIVLRDYSDLLAWRGGPIALAVGFFDGLHLGHRVLLERLRIQAARLEAHSLVVTFSNSPRLFHNPDLQLQYLTTAEEKLYLLGQTGVDSVLMLRYGESVAKQSAAMFLKGIAHGAELRGITVGYDNSIGSDLVRGYQQFAELTGKLGLELEFVEQLDAVPHHIKSSAARELVSKGAVAELPAILGRPYLVMGKVERGKGKGREVLGIPTANIKLAPEKLCPAYGVYAAQAELGGDSYPAAVCFMSSAQASSTVLERDGAPGRHPAADTQSMLEVHLVGLDKEIYEETLRLSIVERLRDWIDFDTAEGLRAQMQQDIADTLKVLEEAAND